jgi:hypothetical protein
MICKNCGANIKNRETYCPSCGMELMVPYSKSLKEKYIAGEYQDNPKNSIGHNKRNPIGQEEEFRHVEHEQYHGTETHEEYQPQGSGSSALLAIILFLVVALLIGFVLGIILFSGALHQIPIFSNITL